MKGYINNIEKETLKNNDFRRVIFTGPNSQLVLMSLQPGEEIGMEVHNVDQFLRIEKGEGKVILDGEEFLIADGTAIVVPAGTHHNVINTGSEEMKLYTIYSPPNHKPETIHKTKAEADQAEAEEHYN